MVYAIHADCNGVVYVFDENEEYQAEQTFNALTALTNAVHSFPEYCRYITREEAFDSKLSFFEWAKATEGIYCDPYENIEAVEACHLEGSIFYHGKWH